jgi:hypothetical protein
VSLSAATARVSTHLQPFLRVSICFEILLQKFDLSSGESQSAKIIIYCDIIFGSVLMPIKAGLIEIYLSSLLVIGDFYI